MSVLALAWGSSGPASAAGSHSDFNGDGKSDLVWRNASTGHTAIWLMDGLGVASSAIIWSDGNWHVTHVGDFNGDGKSDLVWRNDSSGRTAIWLMDGLGAMSSATIWGEWNWEVTHVGDFNGDGKSDLVWRSYTGQTALWLMNGTAAIAASIVMTDADWYVRHIGDFNGDGKSDLVWLRYTHGLGMKGPTALWLMDGTSATVASLVMPNVTGWQVTHTGDFNGDGKSDLVWFNYDPPQQNALWLMDGTSATAATIVTPFETSWLVTHTGDFNGDRKDDLIWSWADDYGIWVAIWLMDGLVATAASLVLEGWYPDTWWEVTHTGNFDGDGKTDLLWQKVDFYNPPYWSEKAIWLMNGTAPVSSAIFVPPDPQWVVVASEEEH